MLTCFFLKLLVLTRFSQTRASQKKGKIDSVLVLTDCNLEPWGKLPSFGVDMFFSNSWNPIFGKLTSFGVDMFLSQLLESKKNVKIVKIV